MIFAYVLFFSFIAIFLATGWVTIGGLIGKLPVQEGYLKILVGSLLVEVAAALIFQFKTLDLTTNPQQLEKEIMAVQMPVKKIGAEVTAKEKLDVLLDNYRKQGQEHSDLADRDTELKKTREQLSALGSFKDKLSNIFRSPLAVSNVTTAFDEIFANQGIRPLIDDALGKHNFYDVTQPGFVWRALKELKPEHPVSQALAALRKNRLGPFSSSGFAVFVSIPDRLNIDKAEAVVRTDSPFQGNWIHLVDDQSGGDVWVQGTRLHERDPILDFKSGQKCELIQLSSDAACQLFKSRTFKDSRKVAQATIR